MKAIKIQLVLSVAILFTTCSKNDSVVIQEKKDIELISPLIINKHIKQSIDEKGDFNWLHVEEKVLWSAIRHGKNILTIGYGSSFNKELKSAENHSSKQRIIELLLTTENNGAAKLKLSKDIVLSEYDNLKVIDVLVSNINSIKELKKLKGIRYMEPSGYLVSEYEEELKRTMGGGCSFSPANIDANDFVVVGDVGNVSWNYYVHNIPSAWRYSKGRGVTVGIIDTGVSPFQQGLGEGFGGVGKIERNIQKYGTYIASPWPWSSETDGVDDKCGHGTQMASTIAAPMNNKDQSVGVAPECNLISYRATRDVLLEGYHEQKGVAEALIQLANNKEVKIISMSIGNVYSIGKISDAIKYAYYQGKLIIAAGGTSTIFTNWTGVIFPARMDEVIAVTGLQDNGYNVCDICHKGSEIDFTVVMQREANGKRCTVAYGYYENDKYYAPGSSVAAAFLSGIAALIWANHEDWSRDQVVERLKQSADFYQNPSSDFGYGNIDVLKAVS